MTYRFLLPVKWFDKLFSFTLPIVALTAAIPAEAAEPIGPGYVTQTDTRFGDWGFASFDKSLGGLLKVKLDITPDFRRAFQFIYPGDIATSPVSWNAGNEQFCAYGKCTELVASGQKNLGLTYSSGLFGGSSYDYLTVNFSGRTISTELDIALFQNPPYPGFRHYMTAPDPGLYDDSLVDIFSIADGGFARNATSILCRSSFSGCDNTRYTLTYVYAPGGVPEPMTWIMMVAGFGAVGFALRHRPKSQNTMAGVVG